MFLWGWNAVCCNTLCLCLIQLPLPPGRFPAQFLRIIPPDSVSQKFQDAVTSSTCWRQQRLGRGSLLAANGWNPCSRFFKVKYSSPILSSNILLLGGRGRNCEIIWGREGHRRSYLQLIAGSNHFPTGFGARLIIESTQITNQSTFFRLILHRCTFYRDSE